MAAQGSNDLSRRTLLLGIGASGLAAALTIQKVEATLAQDATPRVGSELPEGVGFTSLSSVVIRDMPTQPFKIVVSRITLEPGAVVPNSALPYPSMVYLEKGDEVICPPGGEGRFITDAEGKLVNSGGDEMAFPAGTWCYTTPNTMDGVRNDGTDQASGLSLELVPSES
jgi:hypothetical protein